MIVRGPVAVQGVCGSETNDAPAKRHPAGGRADGLWEGWIAFDGDALRSSRETTQPNRDTMMYWAQGLTATCLDRALGRALDDATSPGHEGRA